MMRKLAAMMCFISLGCCAHTATNVLVNPSFESGMGGWSANPSYSVQVVTSGWNGVAAASGSRFLAVSGPAAVGYTYAEMVSQSRSAPFGTGIPDDNFLLYLYAQTYLHTNDGRAVSYALTLEPGYGAMGAAFHGGQQNQWVLSQTKGWYSAHDFYDSASPVKPIKVVLELRDSLGAGEYLLLDNLGLYYGGAGVPEPSILAAVLAGICPVVLRSRRRGRP